MNLSWVIVDWMKERVSWIENNSEKKSDHVSETLMRKIPVHHAVMSFQPFEHNLFSHSLFQLLISAFLPNKKKL